VADFLMPSLGADMETGTVVEWLVAPGTTVARGDVVLVVETHKGNIEVEIWQAGTVAELLVPEGAEVPVGTPLARIDESASSDASGAGSAAEPASDAASEAFAPSGASGASAPTGASTAATPSPGPGATVGASAGSSAPSAAATPSPGPGATVGAAAGSSAPSAAATPSPGPNATVGASAGSSAPSAAATPSPGPNATVGASAGSSAAATPSPGPGAWWIRSSPAARRRAHTLGVDLRALGAGTGPDGAIILRDLDRPPSASGPVRAASVPADVDPMRLAIARAMERSNREIPHYYLDHTVDVEPLLAWVVAYNADRPITARIVPALIFVRAVAVALRAFPDLHGTWVDGRHVAAPGIHPAVAVSLRTGGLVVPALRDADRGDLADLMARFTDLVTRARAGRLRASELYEATTTVTSLGDRGVDGVYGVIYPPQVSIVGFGTVAPRPWAIDGMLAVRRVVRITLAGDHRASDGHRGGLFLARIAHLLAHLEEL